jgi:hypothetical protein
MTTKILSIILTALFTCFVPVSALATNQCADIFQAGVAIQIIQVPSFSGLMDRIRMELERRNYKSSTIVVRSFGGERLRHFLKNGTDRDRTSELFNFPIADASKEDRVKAGVNDEDVIYALKVDVSQKPAMSVGFNSTTHEMRFDPVNLESHFDRMDEFKNIPLVVAVYDSAKLKRGGEAEFWFDGDPREAVLFAFSYWQTSAQ